MADKGIGPVRGPCRSTLWPIRRLATYRLADSGPFVVISALIALPFGQLPLLGPLSLYPLAVSALSCVPFVSVSRRAPLSSHHFQVFRLSRVPSGPRRSTNLRNLHLLAEVAPWRIQTSFLSRRLSFLHSPERPEGAPGATKGALGPPGALGKHGLAITRSVLERHGLSKGCGLAVLGEALRGLMHKLCHCKYWTYMRIHARSGSQWRFPSLGFNSL